MPIISFICLLFFLLILITGFKRNSDFLSPGRVFALLWLFVIGLVEFKFSKLQPHWNSIDWYMALLGILTFLSGIYISYIINLDKSFLLVSEIRIKIRELGLNEKKLFRFIVIYFFIYLICFIAEWQIEGYLPLFTAKPDRARILFGIFGLHLIVSSANVILFLIIQYFIFIKANIKKKWFLIFVFIVAMGNYILIVQRYGLFIVIMMAFCLIYYSGRKVKLRTFIIFGSIIISLIIGIQSLRTTELITAYIIIDSKMKLSPQYAEFAIPYMYVVMSIENFAKYYSHINNHSFGFFTFDFLSALTGIKHWVEEYYNFDKFRLHIGGYNTFPFYWAYYYDFGIAGLALIPFIIGFVISEIYYYLHRSPNIIILTLFSIAFAVISISYSSDPLTRLDMMFNFSVIVFAQYYFWNKPTGEPSNSIKLSESE
jgi:oligosaccharide repeat unit polymerase